MESIAEGIPAQAVMPRFEDGCTNLQELIRRIAEDVANGAMAAETEMYTAGVSARKVECAAAKLGIDAETRPRAERLGRLPWKRRGWPRKRPGRAMMRVFYAKTRALPARTASRSG